MNNYYVEWRTTVFGFTAVEASDKQEAKEKVQNELSLDRDYDYMEDFEVVSIDEEPNP